MDIAEGLRYVLSHPVLRNISLMMALVNFVASTTYAQLVLFAKERLGAGDAQVGLIFSAGSVGVVVLGLAAGALRKRWSFSTVALGAPVAETTTAGEAPAVGESTATEAKAPAADQVG